MDAVGLDRANVGGISEGGPLAMLFAAMFPERVDKLVLYATFARYSPAADYPAGSTIVAETVSMIEPLWGSGEVLKLFVQHPPDPDTEQRMMSKFERYTATPQQAAHILGLINEIDVRAVLPSVQAPTLVVHCQGRPDGAGCDGSLPGRASPELRAVPRTRPRLPRELALGRHGSPGRRRRGVPHGDHHEQPRLNRACARDGAVHRHRRIRRPARATSATSSGAGCSINTMVRASTRWLSTRAAWSRRRATVCSRCSMVLHVGCDAHKQILRRVQAMGLALRAGIHVGECEQRGDDIAGMAVNIAARVMHEAADNELLVTRTVKDLSLGSGLAFTSQGSRELKGVPGPDRGLHGRLNAGGAAVGSTAGRARITGAGDWDRSALMFLSGASE